MTEAEVRAREAFFETATFLLDRELQRSRIAPRRHDDEGHGAAADSLEVSASNTLKEFKSVCAFPDHADLGMIWRIDVGVPLLFRCSGCRA